MDDAKFKRILTDLHTLHVAKTKDYGEAVNYFPFGNVSYAQMIHVKSQRIVSLARQGGTATFESMQDSVKDLIVYSLMFIDHLEKQ